jgi:hypothetical protein
MLELKLLDQKCELDIRGKRHECLAEMTIAFDALIESAAEANGMTYEKAKQMLCDGADKVREVKMRDGE